MGGFSEKIGKNQKQLTLHSGCQYLYDISCTAVIIRLTIILLHHC